MDDIKVLIADSSLVYKAMIAQAVNEARARASATSATDGDETIKSIKRSNYDLIIIDAELAGNNLFELIRSIKVDIPKAYVLVMARPSSANEQLFHEAISKGATECMVKPIYDSYGDNLDIIKCKINEILDSISEGKEKKEPRKAPEPKNLTVPFTVDGFYPEILLVAASTGGPLALETVLTRLSADFPVPILIVQHIPASFTENLARSLDQKSKIKVKIAEDNETASAGTAYLAPGGAHMKLDSRNKLCMDDSPPRSGLRPAADVLFESVARDFTGSKVLAVILTGMGSDGKDGLIMLKDSKDCVCITQSEETCVVYGMPRVVAESGLADRVLDLAEISSGIESFFNK